MLIKADFHIHSCLSPCGDLQMSPIDIVDRAVSLGLNLIAIADHNSAMNCPTLAKICAKRENIDCLFGIEVTSIEEVHNLVLFESLDAVMECSEYVYSHLPDIANNPDIFGDQVYVDEENVILGEVDKQLGNATDLSIGEIGDFVHAHNGLFIPAHIERALFSMTSQLGFLPHEDFDAVELSKFYYKKKYVHSSTCLEFYEGYPALSNSDAHYLEDIGKIYNEFSLDALSLQSMKEKLWAGEWNLCINF